MIPTLESLAIPLVLLCILVYTKISRKSDSEPPGPPGKPIIGNVLQVPKTRPWLAFTEWGSVYGGMFLVKIFSRRLIIINSFDLVLDLFESRSAIYSDRPKRTMAVMSGFHKALLFTNYGERAQKSRRLLHAELNSRAAKTHQALQIKETWKFARNLLDDPSSFNEHIHSAITSSLLTIGYGHDSVKDDPLVSLLDEVLSSFEDIMTPNQYLVDALPFLRFFPKWFPGMGFQKTANHYKKNLVQFMESPFIEVQAKMRNGTAKPSFIQNHLESHVGEMNKDDAELLAWTVGGMVAAGTDTTMSVMSSFFLLMALHPHVQAKAQAELDALLGPSSLPSFADRPLLPYLECVMKEVLRWSPPVPLIAHRTRSEDIVNGYHIPSESIVVANIWALTRDNDLYNDPSKFDPDRFVGDSSRTPDPVLYVFGLGRRNCPGIHLANALLYIMMATTLTAFNIVPELDDKGDPVLPKVEYSTGVVSFPAPFKCRIIPRSSEASHLVSCTSEAG